VPFASDTNKLVVIFIIYFAKLLLDLYDPRAAVFSFNMAREEMSAVYKGDRIVTICVAYDLNQDGIRGLERITSSVMSGGICIVIDNGPLGCLPANLERRLRSGSPGTVSISRYLGNRGFGAGCNAGVDLAPFAPFLLFVNPDAEITPETIDALLVSFTANPQLGVASPQLVDHTGSPAETASSFPTVYELTMGKFRKPPNFRHRKAVPDNLSPLRAYAPADWVSGAVMMIRREAWDAVGGFDPRFFLYYEDIDLCRRVRAAGWEVGIVHSVTAIHESGGSQWRPGTRTRVERIYFESQAYYFRKHHGRLMEWLLRAVRLPYLATRLRRRFLERYGVRNRVANDPA
jgi:GT2 family glycosyltransferase